MEKSVALPHKGKTTTSETTQITQKQSNLNFSNDLNIQSASDTTITASNLTADNATILTGKFRDTLGSETITNTDAKLTLNSAFDTSQTNTTTEKVSPNYVGIALTAGATAYIGYEVGKWAVPNLSKAMNVSPKVISIWGVEAGIAYTGTSLNSGLDPTQKSFMDPLLNTRTKSSSSSSSSTEIKTNLNFNNLITE